MTNNSDNQHEENEGFEEPEIGIAEQPRSMTGNLAEAWRTRPMFKFMVLIVAIFAVGVAGFSFLGGSNVASETAHLGKPPAMKEAPGGTVSPYMRQQTELANKERSEQAIANGGSALPTPIGQNSDISGFGSGDKKDEALNELRAETQQLKAQVQQQQAQQIQAKQQSQQQQQMQQVQRAPEQFDNSLAEAMQMQMKQMLESWKPEGIKEVEVIKAADLKAGDKSVPAEITPANGTVLASESAAQAKIVVNAGTVSYAQLLTEANSDVPGPILAQIVSGPLAGARAVGSFQVSQGYEKYLVLKFSLADQKGKDYSINAYALDPNTTLGGMATEVDERYFVRVVLPAAAGFLQGMGEALGEGNSSISTNGTVTATTIASNGYKQGIYNGLGQAAQTMGQFFQNQANLTKPLVRVAAGTPIGMFFVSPVTEPTNNTGVMPAVANQQNSGNGLGGNAGIGQGAGGMMGGPQGGYPGATVAGYGGNNNNPAASGAPYPNYAVPGYGYSGNMMNRSPTINNNGSSYMPSYGQ